MVQQKHDLNHNFISTAGEVFNLPIFWSGLLIKPLHDPGNWQLRVNPTQIGLLEVHMPLGYDSHIASSSDPYLDHSNPLQKGKCRHSLGVYLKNNNMYFSISKSIINELVKSWEYQYDQLAFLFKRHMRKGTSRWLPVNNIPCSDITIV